jgi:hypothetical protein
MIERTWFCAVVALQPNVCDRADRTVTGAAESMRHGHELRQRERRRCEKEESEHVHRQNADGLAPVDLDQISVSPD